MNEGRYTVQLVHMNGGHPITPAVYVSGFPFGPHVTVHQEHAFGSDDANAAEVIACMANRVWPSLCDRSLFRAVPKNKTGGTP